MNPTFDDDAALDAIVASHVPDSGDEEAIVSPPEEPVVETQPEPVPEPEAPAQVQEPVVEVTPTPAAPEPDRSLQLLIEQQRQVQQSREAFQQERRAYEQEKAELQERLSRFEAFQTKLTRDDALGALKDIGIEFDALSRAVLQNRGVNPTSQLEAQMTERVSETERRLQQKLDQLEAAEARRQEEEFVLEASQAIRELSPLVAGMGHTGVQAVWDRFKQASQRVHSGEAIALPTYEEVVREVEREAESFLRPLLETETVRGWLKPAPQPPREASPTLSNQQAATVPTRTEEPEPEHGGYGYDEDGLLERIARKYS